MNPETMLIKVLKIKIKKDVFTEKQT